jgi:hypothetical protein
MVRQMDSRRRRWMHLSNRGRIAVYVRRGCAGFGVMCPSSQSNLSALGTQRFDDWFRGMARGEDDRGAPA